MSKKCRLLILFALLALFGGIYWGFGNTEYTVPITYAYYALCIILSVLYILVAGGIRPIAEEDRRREEKSRKQYLADKGKSHPIKRRDKYRRFRIKAEEEEKAVPEQLPPAPNPLGIPEEKRGKICTWILLVAIPLYVIFILDWIYLKFFAEL